ncbi:MAG: HAMP domain-containing sensor histidine kinase [Bacteroidota bacterium]
MQASHTKRLSAVALIAILGLMLLQSYWFWRAFDRERNLQAEQTQLALRQAAHEIFRQLGDSTSSIAPIQQDGNQFLLRIEHPLLFDMVEQEVNDALALHQQTAPYRLMVLDCEQQNILMGFDLAIADTARELPCTERVVVKDCYYLRLRFPTWGQHLLGEIWIWWATAMIFLLMIAYFVYNLVLMQREKRLAEMRQDFVNNLTHEFRSPITNIGLAQEALQKMAAADFESGRAQAYLAIIEQENKRLKEQTERILQAAQAQGAGLALSKRTIDLNDLLNDLCKQFALRVEKRGGEIRFLTETASQNAWVDPFHLRNALSNLIDNAIKYSPDAPKLTLRLSQAEQKILLTIKDQGQGIEAKDFPHLFDPFFRVSTGNRHDVKGFGLGLSYVRQVVEAHEGQIIVDSKVGLGSTFKLILPRGA